ncbi:MAG: M48 family metalloprotease [Candidatus Bathyarchaeota archaeon]|nr:MAG: M48 family metalloprotease [Candidatus Bathyarchaeota archaeon]
MSLRLRLSMATTVAVIIGVSTLGLSIVLGLFNQLNLYTLIATVAIFNIAQWFLAPYIVNSMYGVRQLEDGEKPELHSMVRELSARSGMGVPKLMLSKIPIPNAFAYGSPLTGNHVAVTQGLLSELEDEEIEAVIGHELGHIKHRDMQVMMFISFLPSLFYIIARSTLFSRYYGGRDRRDSGGFALLGGVSMAIYFLLLLFNLNLSRLREYYADQHSANIIPDGARKLSEGLAKISSSTWRIQRGNRGGMAVSGFKTLFISDPDRAMKDAAAIHRMRYGDDELVRNIVDRDVSTLDSILEFFSTHPNIVKRLRALSGRIV